MKLGDKIYVYEAQFRDELEISEEIKTVIGFDENAWIEYESEIGNGHFNPLHLNTLSIDKRFSRLVCTEDKLSEMKEEWFVKIREQIKENLEEAKRTIESASKNLLQLENPEKIEVMKGRLF